MRPGRGRSTARSAVAASFGGVDRVGSSGPKRRAREISFSGLPGQVPSGWRAVTVLGMPTVRAIATAAAFDLFSETGRSVPDDFWPHSVTTAAAAAAIARRIGIQPNDAFGAGVLHDL